jgi:hypothetical protein
MTTIELLALRRRLLIGAVLLPAACGGGGTGDTLLPVALVPPASGVPTAALAVTQKVAGELVDLLLRAARALVKGTPLALLDGFRVMGTPVVALGGTAVTITSGTIRGYYGGSDWVEITFADFSYDANTGHATRGTVAIVASSGDRAAIVVTESGFSVSITVGGTTVTFTVTG